MDMAENKHMDEVIEYASQRFGTKEKPCDIYLSGFSLGGNHVLRYSGQAAKEATEGSTNTNDLSSRVKAIVTISSAFDIYTTG